MTLLSYEFMQRAAVAALIIGVLAPAIGVFLVQRRLALLGDGMGHVALTGVGLALLAGTQPIATALVVAVVGALLVELIRTRSRSVGDVALALVFYGGIAGGVLLASLAPQSTSAALNQYLFGSLVTVSTTDVLVLAGGALATGVVLFWWWRDLFLLSLDPDLAHVQGVRVRAMSITLSVLAAVAVVIGMRTVGLLLVSAIMIVPVAAAQQLTRSFATTTAGAIAIGVVAAAGGLFAAFHLALPPGPAIVVLALAVFLVTAVAQGLRRSR